MLFYVKSSNGLLVCDAETGCPISEKSIYYSEKGLERISRFDLEEYRETYPERRVEGSVIDILDLGYWTISYEIPAHDWRELMTEMEGKGDAKNKLP